MSDEQPDLPAVEFALGPLADDDIDLLLAAFDEQPNDAYRVVTEETDGYRVGDPGTLVVIVVVSNATIGALAAFLAKRRRRSRVRYTLEITDPDGSTRRECLELDTSESEAPPAELVAQLSLLTRTQVPSPLEGSTE